MFDLRLNAFGLGHGKSQKRIYHHASPDQMVELLYK